MPDLHVSDTASTSRALISFCLSMGTVLCPVKASDFDFSDNIPFIVLYFIMGSCKEDAFNDIRSETLQLISIHTETDSACYYIIEDYDCLSSEPLFIKLDDAHLSDFLFSLTVFMNSKSFSAYPYMVISVYCSCEFTYPLQKSIYRISFFLTDDAGTGMNTNCEHLLPCSSIILAAVICATSS